MISLVLPSYATLSSSDGSSFVTKSEFDSALADFNSRLTTFEAGINSKIDSQVTSYLDRNGIWSPKEQVRLAPFDADASAISVSTNVWMKTYYNRNKEWADGLVFWSHTDKLKCVIPLVQEINKSGLCFIDYYVWQWDISMSGNGFESVSAGAYGHNKQTDSAVDYGWSGNLTYAFYEDPNGTTAESSINPVYAKCKGHIVQKVEYAGNMSKNDYYASTSSGGSVNSSFNSNYLRGAYMIAQKVQGTTSFFVSKKSKLYLVMFVYGGGGRHSLNAWCGCNWTAQNNVAGVPQGPSSNIDRVCVY